MPEIYKIAKGIFEKLRQKAERSPVEEYSQITAKARQAELSALTLVGIADDLGAVQTPYAIITSEKIMEDSKKLREFLESKQKHQKT